MSRLDDEYGNDRNLLKLLKYKLLIPGWAGQVDGSEAEYIAEKLKDERESWLKWRKALKKVGYSRVIRRPSSEAIKKWVNDLRFGWYR